MKIVWRRAEYHQLYREDLPRESGVYAVMRIKRVFGIPLTTNVLYVGQSKNLQRRLLEHTDLRRQRNRKLNSLDDKSDLEFWYAPVKAAELDAVERQLIRELEPSYNIVRYANV